MIIFYSKRRIFELRTNDWRVVGCVW